MAEEALKKLEQQLECAVCFGSYTDPKQLQCQHIYCKQCLVSLVYRNEENQLILPCPICRKLTPVPDNGVTGLQSAFQINSLLEIQESLKKTPLLSMKDREGSSDSAAATPLEAVPHCSEHTDEELKLYCSTCDSLICLKCVIKDAHHQNHDYALLNKACDQFKEEISKDLAPVEEKLVSVDEVLLKLDKECGEISEQRMFNENSIDNIVGRFHQMLDVRKTELIRKLHEVTQSKLKSLAAQRDHLETSQAQLRRCVDSVRDTLQSGTPLEVMKAKPVMGRQVSELTQLKLTMLDLCAKADLMFVSSLDFPAVCRGLGKFIETNKMADPSKCVLTDTSLGSVVGTRTAVIIQAMDYHSKPCRWSSDSLHCKLVSLIKNAQIETSVKEEDDGKYEIGFTLVVKGAHRLHVEIEGKPIQGSPFPVLVRSQVSDLGTPVSTIADLKGPWGVAVDDKSGAIVVTEESGHCVSVFSPDGRKIRSFGTRGSTDGQFNHPRGVAVDKEGNIVVADYKNHRIQKFKADGTFLAAVGQRNGDLRLPPKPKPLQFCFPKAIAFNRSNGKYCILDEHGHCQVLNPDLTFSHSIGKPGILTAFTPPGHLCDSWGLACDYSGNVYVSDSLINRIQVFTADGECLWHFGKHGKSQGKLNFPAGIAVDSGNMVFVAERHNHRVSVFDSGGNHVTSFGSHGKRPGELNYPRGLALDECGVIYVCDNNNNCLQMF